MEKLLYLFVPVCAYFMLTSEFSISLNRSPSYPISFKDIYSMLRKFVSILKNAKWILLLIAVVLALAVYTFKVASNWLTINNSLSNQKIEKLKNEVVELKNLNRMQLDSVVEYHKSYLEEERKTTASKQQIKRIKEKVNEEVGKIINNSIDSNVALFNTLSEQYIEREKR